MYGRGGVSGGDVAFISIMVGGEGDAGVEQRYEDGNARLEEEEESCMHLCLLGPLDRWIRLGERNPFTV